MTKMWDALAAFMLGVILALSLMWIFQEVGWLW